MSAVSFRQSLQISRLKCIKIVEILKQLQLNPWIRSTFYTCLNFAFRASVIASVHVAVRIIIELDAVSQ
jgi:hypothetical protein